MIQTFESLKVATGDLAAGVVNGSTNGFKVQLNALPFHRAKLGVHLKPFNMLDSCPTKQDPESKVVGIRHLSKLKHCSFAEFNTNSNWRRQSIPIFALRYCMIKVSLDRFYRSPAELSEEHGILFILQNHLVQVKQLFNGSNFPHNLMWKKETKAEGHRKIKKLRMS